MKCTFCAIELDPGSLLVHVERFHVGLVEEMKLICPDCPFRVTKDHMDLMITHCLLMNHNHQLVKTDWEKEEDRTLRIFRMALQIRKETGNVELASTSCRSSSTPDTPSEPKEPRMMLIKPPALSFPSRPSSNSSMVSIKRDMEDVPRILPPVLQNARKRGPVIRHHEDGIDFDSPGSSWQSKQQEIDPDPEPEPESTKDSESLGAIAVEDFSWGVGDGELQNDDSLPSSSQPSTGAMFNPIQEFTAAANLRRNSVPPSTLSGEPNQKTMECQLCGKPIHAFYYKNGKTKLTVHHLANHVLSTHFGNESIFRCSGCHYTSPRRDYVTTHIQRSCRNVGKSFIVGRIDDEVEIRIRTVLATAFPEVDFTNRKLGI